MRDLLFVALTLGFFAIAATVVRLCDRIVGPDVLERSHDREDLTELSARPEMTFDNGLGLLLALLTAAYLVAALVIPERF